MRTESVHVLACTNAGFTDKYVHMFSNEVQHAKHMRRIGFHRCQVPVVHAQETIAWVGKAQVGLNTEQVFHVVNLHERGHAQLVCKNQHVHELAFRQQFRDQQYRVRPADPCLPHLVGIDQEVLPEYREAGALPDRRQIFH